MNTATRTRVNTRSAVRRRSASGRAFNSIPQPAGVDEPPDGELGLGVAAAVALHRPAHGRARRPGLRHPEATPTRGSERVELHDLPDRRQICRRTRSRAGTPPRRGTRAPRPGLRAPRGRPRPARARRVGEPLVAERSSSAITMSVGGKAETSSRRMGDIRGSSRTSSDRTSRSTSRSPRGCRGSRPRTSGSTYPLCRCSVEEHLRRDVDVAVPQLVRGDRRDEKPPRPESARTARSPPRLSMPVPRPPDAIHVSSIGWEGPLRARR